jgi:putative ABC transport system permease protein
MLPNYLPTVLRHLRKHATFSVINIAGLAIALAACLLILEYVSFKLSYDQFNSNLSSLYRVVNDRYQSGNLIQHGTATYSAIGKALDDDYEEVINHARIAPAGEKIVVYEDKKLSERKTFYVDHSFFSMFSFPVVAGNVNTMIRQPHTIAITESLARRIFGDMPLSSLVGKNVTLQRDTTPYKIDAVLKDVPQNSHLQFNMLVSYPTLVQMWPEADYNFTQSEFWHYIQLRDGTDYKAFNVKLNDFTRRHFQGTKVSGSDERFVLQPLSHAHLYSDFEYDIAETGNATAVWGLVVIAAFIITIAWFNYINLATAKSVERAREVGIRKVIGGRRSQLIIQFMLEAVLVNIISIGLAVLIAVLLQPYFNELLQYNLSLSFLFEKGLQGYSILLSLIALVAIGILISGLYPAFVLSSYKPVTVLKGKILTSKSGLSFRKAIVVGQFSITVALAIGSIVALRQIKFMNNAALGFNMDQIMVVNPPRLTQWDSSFVLKMSSFKEELKNLSHVIGAASSWQVPGSDMGRSFDVRRADSMTGSKFTLGQTGVDYDFLPLYQVKLLAGRQLTNADHNLNWDHLHNTIINQSAAKMLGFVSPNDAIGKSIYSGEKKWDIVGVVEDYHQKSLKYPIEPIQFMPAFGTGSTISVKINTNDVKATVEEIKNKYESFFPGNLFDFEFLNDRFNRQYDNERLFARVFGIFAALAIVIASLGVFGLAMFSTTHRVKEIGVRKVLGASVGSILILLSSDFSKLIILASLIASPIAWLVMHRWLEDFTYRTNISWWIFVVAGIGAFLLALMTIGLQAFKAANSNPVKSLRTE